MAGDKIKGLSLAIGGDTGGLAKALKDINDRAKDLQTDLKTVERLLKLDPTNTVLLAQKQDLLAKNIGIAEERLKALVDCESDVQKAFEDGTIDQTQFIEFQKELVNARKKLEDLKAQEKETKENTAELGNETQNAKKDIKTLGDEAQDTKKDTKDLGEETQQTKKNIKDLGDQSVKSGDILKESLKAEAIVSGLKVIGNAIKDVSTAAINVGSDFEASMSQVAATMGMTKEDVQNGTADYKNLEKAAADMGATTKYTSAEAADALNYLALAGYDANKAVETLPKILTIAQAGGMDLATTSDLVTDSMGALQLSTEDLDMFVDQLAKTSQKSNTNVQQLGEGLLVVAGTSVSTGQDLSKINTALGILANNGLKGSEGGTKLRNILLSLTAPTDQAAEKMEELGLSVTDSSGKIRDIDEIMSDLNNTLGKMSESERTQVLNEIFNKQDLAGVSSLLASTSGEFQNLHKNIVNSNGAAADMAETMNDNLKGRMAEVRSALEAVGIAAYKKFEIPLKDAAKKSSKEFSKFADSINSGELSDSFEDLGESFETFVDVGLEAVELVIPPLTKGLSWILEKSPTIIGGLSGIAAAMITQKTVSIVSKTAKGFGDLASAINKAKGAQQTFNAISSASPWGTIATLVGLAAGAIATYKLKTETAADKMKYLNKEQKTLVKQSQELNDEIKDNQKTRQDNIEDTEAQWQGYKTMAEKLYELNEAETISVGAKAQMKGMVDELNKAIPELNLQLDEETGHLKTQKDVVMDLINSNLELAKIKGAQESLSAISKDLAEAEINAGKLGDKYKAVQKDYTEAANKSKEALSELKQYIIDTGAETEESLSRYTPDEFINIAKDLSKVSEEESKKINELSDAYNDNKEKAEKDESATKKLKSEYESANKTLESVQKEWNTTTKYISDHSEKLEKAAETAEVSTEKMKITVGKYKNQTVEVISTTISEIQKLEDEYQANYAKRTKELQESLDIFKEFSLNSEVTADSLLKNMESNLEGISNWAAGLNTLAKRGLDEGLIATLREAGPTSASEVAAMTQMTDEQLDKYNNDWKKYLKKTKEIASSEMQGARNEINKKVDGAIRDMKNKKEDMKSSSKTMMDGTKEGVQNGLNEIDRIMKESNIPESARTLIEDIIKNTGGMSNEIFNAWWSVGTQIPAGTAAGIADRSPEVMEEISRLTEETIAHGKHRFGVHSPSRVFREIGDYCIQGQILGMKDRAKDLFAEIDSINSKVIDRAQNVSLGNALSIANQSARQLVSQDEHQNARVTTDNMRNTNSGTFNFNVTFSGVTINNDQDLNVIADKLMYIMEQKTRRREAVYS